MIVKFLRLILILVLLSIGHSSIGIAQSDYTFVNKSKPKILMNKFSANGSLVVSFSGMGIPVSFDSSNGLQFKFDELVSSETKNKQASPFDQIQKLQEIVDIVDYQQDELEAIQKNLDAKMIDVVTKAMQDSHHVLDEDTRARIKTELRLAVKAAENEISAVLMEKEQQQPLSISIRRRMFELNPLEYLTSQEDEDFELDTDQTNAIEQRDVMLKERFDEIQNKARESILNLHREHLASLTDILTTKQKTILAELLGKSVDDRHLPITEGFDSLLYELDVLAKQSQPQEKQ